MTTTWTSRAATPSEAAILHHPDRQTAWAPLLVVEVAGAPLTEADVHARLADLASRHWILRARRLGTRWVAADAVSPPTRLGALADLCRPFDLAADAPLRIALATDGRRLALTAHHAALDGRALLTVAAHLLGTPAGEPADVAEVDHAPTPAPAPAAAEPGSSGRSAGAIDALRRLARPADRVAPSVAPPSREVFVSAELPLQASARVAQLAAAACAAAQDWNGARGAPWRRVGLTIPVGGPPVLGNVSTHRRVDLPATADPAAAVQHALRAAHGPASRAPHPAVLRMLAPVVHRFSDSLLVSNLGLVTLPGAAAVDFYPQARGRSAVALGAASVVGGGRRLTLRARDLTEDDARALLDSTLARL
ncbi:MAG: hypothetical protein JHD16_02180 [Solirubrobacteraceae bacterium]|nr:hypothetical protein [Solirubrobacteraceae bacterium]